MNIFYLDNSPTQAAQYHCNKHVIKMILETAQLLSSAHHLLDEERIPEGLYKLTHKNHPCSIWVRESSSNYNWLYSLFLELCKEYTHRYGKIHKTEAKKDILKNLPKNIKKTSMTTPPKCMPDDVKEGSVVNSYRRYYKVYKAHMLQYKNREIPNWIKES